MKDIKARTSPARRTHTRSTFHSRLLPIPRDDQLHWVGLINVPSEEYPLAENVCERFLKHMFVYCFLFTAANSTPWMRPARRHQQTNKNKLCLLSGLIHSTEVRGRDGLDPTLLAPPPLDLPPARGRARRALALATHSLEQIKC